MNEHLYFISFSNSFETFFYKLIHYNTGISCRVSLLLLVVRRRLWC